VPYKPPSEQAKNNNSTKRKLSRKYSVCVCVFSQIKTQVLHEKLKMTTAMLLLINSDIYTIQLHATSCFFFFVHEKRDILFHLQIKSQYSAPPAALRGLLVAVSACSHPRQKN